MIDTKTLAPGVTLRCFRDSRFKQAFLSLQLIRPMAAPENAANALLPAVLLRGSRGHRDLQAITHRLDALYGASVGSLVRRVGDYQTTGFHCGFMEDRFALAGDRIQGPMVDFLRELLLEPRVEAGGFCPEYVQSEKKNLIATIESELNNKQAYASNQMLRHLCAGDSYGLPRLGQAADVAAITPQGLYDHYRRILRESPVEIFYVGSCDMERVAAQLEPLVSQLERQVVPLPCQSPLRPGPGGDYTERMDIAQGKLAMGFVTPVTNRDPRFGAMQVMNMVFGGGMTSKLFMHIRERESLCYSIGSGYYGSKGILTVSAGIDWDKRDPVVEQVLRELELCRRGEITDQELAAAKEALLSALRGTHDSPGAIENFYATAALSGLPYDVAGYLAAIQAVEIRDVAEAARTVEAHTVYFLKGGTQ